MQVDLTAYKVFKKLKEKHPVKTIKITQQELWKRSVGIKHHRDIVREMFLEEGVIVTRFGHKYDTLSTSDPRLGLVFMASDSVIVPGYEVHALIGHNARYKDGEEA